MSAAANEPMYFDPREPAVIEFRKKWGWLPWRTDHDEQVQQIRGRLAFAAANAWRWTDWGFGFATLAANKIGNHRDSPPIHYGPHQVLDHMEFFRTPDRKAAAIVGHPYPSAEDFDKAARVTEWADDMGLRVQQCPDPKGSWYWSGHTRLVVLTRPDVVVVWPTAVPA